MGIHAYNAAGEPVYQVPMARGKGMRPTRRDDLTRFDLDPSVTTVLGDVDGKANIHAWRERTLAGVAFDLRPEEGEEKDAYVTRLTDASDAVCSTGADLGTKVHAALEAYTLNPDATPEPDMAPYVASGIAKLSELGLTIVAAEQSFSRFGFGGKVDLLCQDRQGMPVIADWKTQKTKNGLFYVSKSWPLQTAAYAAGMVNTPFPVLPRRIIIGLSTAEPGLCESFEFAQVDLRQDLATFWKALDLFQFWNGLKLSRYIPWEVAEGEVFGE